MDHSSPLSSPPHEKIHTSSSSSSVPHTHGTDHHTHTSHGTDLSHNSSHLTVHGTTSTATSSPHSHSHHETLPSDGPTSFTVHSSSASTSSANPESLIQSLQTKLTETEAALQKKDTAIKTMQVKAKEYVTSLDTKWRIKVEELEYTIQDLQTKLTNASASPPSSSSASSTTTPTTDTLDKVRLERDNLKTQVNKLTADIGVLKEQYTITVTERDTAMMVAKSEKKRADEADTARETAAKEARELRAAKESSTVTAAAAATEAALTIDRLRTELNNARKLEVDLRNQINQLQSTIDDRTFEMATVLSAKDALESKLTAAEKVNNAASTNLVQQQNEVRTMQKEMENLRRETENARNAVAMANSKETLAKTAMEEANNRANRAETQLRNEKMEWNVVRVRFEESLATRTAERDRLNAEVTRLNRLVDEGIVEIRKTKAAVGDAEAVAAAARNSATAAETRAQEMENRYNALQSSLRNTDNLSGKLKTEYSTVQEELGKVRREADTLSTELRSARARETELAGILQDAQRRNHELTNEIAGYRARTEAAEARAAAASREALEHQHKRLEAKTELVSVAQALEREKMACSTLSTTLTNGILPKLTLVTNNLQILNNTLDPTYNQQHNISSSDTSSSSSHDTDLDVSMDNDNYTEHLKRFATRLKRSLEMGDNVSSLGSPAAILTNRLNTLLDNAQTATSTAIRAANAVVRQSHSSSNPRLDDDHDPVPPSGPLAFLTSCLLPSSSSSSAHTTHSPRTNHPNQRLGPSSAQTRNSSARRGSESDSPFPKDRQTNGNHGNTSRIFGTGVAILETPESQRGKYNNHTNTRTLSDTTAESIALTLDESGVFDGKGSLFSTPNGNAAYANERNVTI